MFLHCIIICINEENSTLHRIILQAGPDNPNMWKKCQIFIICPIRSDMPTSTKRVSNFHYAPNQAKHSKCGTKCRVFLIFRLDHKSLYFEDTGQISVII